MSIEVRQVSKVFGTFEALRNVSLRVEGGELVALLGPSGSGKTTLLRVIAGLEQADAGDILFDDEDASRRDFRERQVGFVFQHYALFRHMTVFDNVAFGLQVRPRSQRLPKEEIRDRVMRLLALVQIDFLWDRYPSQLSGGQRQRVALARALAVEPKVLLLDEPFGALDAKVRKELRRWLRRLHDEIHVTSVFVTHDQEEALEVADRVVVMNEGGIVQVGTPNDVYHRPASPFVYKFLGDVNLFHARVANGKTYLAPIPAAGDAAALAPGEPVATVYVRPHLLEITYEQPAADNHFAAAGVMHIHPAGPTVKVELETGENQIVQAEITQERYRVLALTKGAEVFVTPLETRVFIEDYSI